MNRRGRPDEVRARSSNSDVLFPLTPALSLLGKGRTAEQCNLSLRARWAWDSVRAGKGSNVAGNLDRSGCGIGGIAEKRRSGYSNQASSDRS